MIVYSQVVAETLKVLLVAVTAAAQQGASNGGNGGAASLMRVLLPLLIQVTNGIGCKPEFDMANAYQGQRQFTTKGPLVNFSDRCSILAAIIAVA